MNSLHLSTLASLLRVRVNISAQWLIGFNSLGIDCFSSTTGNKDLLTNSSMIGQVLIRKLKRMQKLPPYDIIKAKIFYVRLL
ncbi:TPA: hypothetical protein ACGO3V_000183, partial [Streptococcus suis]